MEKGRSDENALSAEGKKQVEQVALLTEFGFRPSEIAIVLARKPTEITSILSKMKKRSNPRAKRTR